MSWALRRAAARHAFRHRARARRAGLVGGLPGVRRRWTPTPPARCWKKPARFASEVLPPINAPGDREGCTLTRRRRDARPPATAPPTAPSSTVAGRLCPAAPTGAARACRCCWTRRCARCSTPATTAGTCTPTCCTAPTRRCKAHASDELKARYLRERGQRRDPGRDGAHRAAGRQRPRPAAHQGASRSPTAACASPAARSSSRGADHDLTDNIVHLVLCRLPDAPAGTKGITLALVPKFLPDGTRNAVGRRRHRTQDGHPRQRHLRA